MNYLLFTLFVILIVCIVFACMVLKDKLVEKENYGNSQAFDPSTRSAAAGIGPSSQEGFCGSCI